MGKERIEEIMRMGYNSKRCSKASAFEVELAKLVTACTIMPSMETGVDFYRDDENGLKVGFYSTSVDANDVEPIVIELDKTLQRTFQLTTAISRVRSHMGLEGLLTQQECLSKNDDILWSALDDTAYRARHIPGAKEGIIDIVKDKALKINTLRKMLNSDNGHSVSEHESLLTTILALIDYYTNSNKPGDPFSRMSVNGRTYFNGIDDFECINRAIRDNCTGDKDVYMNDYLSARNALEDRKASYLAGFYKTKFDCPVFHTEEINVSDADILDPSLNGML